MINSFSYIVQHNVWLYEPSNTLIFIHELISRTDEEVQELLYQRIGETVPESLIQRLRDAYDDDVS